MNEYIFGILTITLLGFSCARLGSLLFLRRLSLVSDAFSHIALPGLALAITFGVSRFLGALFSLLGGAFLVWFVEKKSRIYPEALVGTIFVSSLAIGSLFLKEKELLEAFLGEGTQSIGSQELKIALFLFFFILFFFWKTAKPLFLEIFSPELAGFLFSRLSFNKLLFYILLALAISLGAKIMGILLVGALFILPPSIAKLFSSSLSGFLNLSSFIGIFASLLGFVISLITGLQLSPLIVLVLSLFFVISLSVKILHRRARSSVG